MITNDLLRTREDERQRIALLNAVLSWGRSANGFSSDFSVVVFGSLVRGDYWEGSDLDILPIGGTAEERARVISELGEVARGCGAKDVERWDALSREYFTDLMAVPAKKRTPPYPVQFGLHGFDTIGHHVTVLGADPLIGAAFPDGDDLEALAIERVVAFSTKGHDWEDKTGTAAPEVIKAAVLAASVSAGLAPSRNKHVIVSTFEQLVPDFPGREIWKAVWRRYKAGVKGPIDGEIEFRDALIAAVREQLG